ncbi:hypothetical protein [Oceanobacillus chungangensis]|uniref:Uncharacterized protein n=1 Tax=Oceanobacillus chungangensis TaxID=1229152 RepID=A0A3D8Q365_9BACI|nr:hypothetical protein [Oceanobacillus chungangensis]RDW22119.1 hypothetical protein CWR45_01120 [Oceanobacillus chungangensis]
MVNRYKTFLSCIAGVLVGIIVVNIIRDGEIDWDAIGYLFTITFLIVLIRLGLNLYKEQKYILLYKMVH